MGNFFKTTDGIINTKMFLFGKWITQKDNDVLLKKQLKHFNEVVYPNYKENGSAEYANEFLKDI